MNMLTVKLGVYSDYWVELPATDAELVKLGERFQAHEAELPLAERLKEPDPARLSVALAKAKGGLELAQNSEFTRSESSAAFHAAMTKATTLLKESIEQLTWKYRDNLGQLERWGLPTKIGANGKILVHKPDHEAELAEYLIKYTAREQSLPAADRLTTPALAGLVELATIVQEQGATRAKAQSQRKLGVETRSTTAGPLWDMLQLACGLLVVMRFDGCVTTALEAWGFKVKVGSSPTPEPPSAPPTA